MIDNWAEPMAGGEKAADTAVAMVTDRHSNDVEGEGRDFSVSMSGCAVETAAHGEKTFLKVKEVT